MDKLTLFLTLVLSTCSKDNAVNADSPIVLSTPWCLVPETLQPNQTYAIIILNQDASKFYVPQCHAAQHNFTMEALSQGSNTASDIGIVVTYNFSNVLIRNTAESLLVYCGFAVYDNAAPIPGGCNEEFNFENDPNVHVWFDGFQIWLQFQYANLSGVDCTNSSYYTQLEYSVYAFFFEDTIDTSEQLSSSLRNFLSAEDMQQNGSEVVKLTRKSQGKPALLITSYPNQGVMFGIVVTNSLSGRSSAYVPSVNYGCDLDKPCNVEWYVYVMASLFGVLSVILCVGGHRYFKTGLCISGFLAFYLVAYILLYILPQTLEVVLIGSLVAGLIGAPLWLLVWLLLGLPHLSVLLTAANAGFVLAAILFYTPLVNLNIFQNDWQMWMIYAVLTLLLPMVAILLPKKVNIFSCCFLGSFGVVSCLSVYIGATIHHILAEVIRRAVIDKYYDAIFAAPFHPKDVGLAFGWFLLLVASSFLQFYRERKRAAFPDSPRLCRKREVVAITEVPNNERQPLISSLGNVDAQARMTPVPYYGAVEINCSTDSVE